MPLSYNASRKFFSSTAADILTAVTVLIADANTDTNVTSQLDEASIIGDRLVTRFQQQCDAGQHVTIPGSKADFAAVYATLITITDGAVFTVSSSQDTTDTALATAKGSAPVAGDTFQRVGTAPVYKGAAAALAAAVAVLVAY
jgi:hypothetical protein